MKRTNACSVVRARRCNPEEGSKHPREIFPELVWEIIFDKLDDSEDVVRVSHASPVFRKILRERYMFSQILLPRVLALPEFQAALKSNLDRGSFKQFQSTLFNLRLVNRRWRDGVDQFVKQDITRNIANCDWKVVRLTEQSDYYHCFTLSFRSPKFQQLESILSDLRETTRTFCVPTRSVVIELDHPQVLDNDDEAHSRIHQLVSEKVEDFLDHVGSTILEAEVVLGTARLRQAGIRPSDICFSLRKWFLSMPNLHELTIRLIGIPPNLSSEDQRSEKEEMIQEVKRNPFPTSNHLKKLTFEVTIPELTGFDGRLFTTILKANTGVQEVTLDLKEYYRMRNAQGLIRILRTCPKIEALSICGFEEFIWKNSPYDVKINVFNSNWSLRKLQMSKFINRDGPKAFFRFLERFQTLEWLDIQIYFSWGSGKPVPFDDKVHMFCGLPCHCGTELAGNVNVDLELLHLPNLKYFSVTIHPLRFRVPGAPEIVETPRRSHILFISSIECMKPMRKLEKFSWHNKEMLTSVEEDMIIDDDREIQWRKGNSLETSNIWDILPLLQEVEVQKRRDILVGPNEWITDVGSRVFRRENRRTIV